ncbi:MAG TPA: sigma-70 family RNA polymerase sigma factor [Anaerolineales bacterium]|nr:sigma-70 family RNA polymerase sigma factor [Anaerolineales bacterium]
MKVFKASGVNYTERMIDAHPSWLVSECIAGNEDAIEFLIRHYEVGVFKLALSILDDSAEATEITQETFIAALRSLKKYQEQQSFKAWLYTIVVNLSRSHLRKRKTLDRLRATLTTLFRVELQKQLLPEDTVIQNEKEVILWTSLNQLDERHRIVVVLRYFHDLSINEISEILSIHEGTIHSRLHTAREKLRSALVDINGE